MALADAQMNEDQALPPGQGAFVIQFRSPADVEQGCFAGRAEHVASGEVTRFQSPEELLAFVRHVLTGMASGPDAEA